MAGQIKDGENVLLKRLLSLVRVEEHERMSGTSKNGFVLFEFTVSIWCQQMETDVPVKKIILKLENFNFRKENIFIHSRAVKQEEEKFLHNIIFFV